MSGAVYHQPDPVVVCRRIRDSFQDSGFVYTNGACFQFFLILKSIFPQARPWTNIDHVWTEIDGRFYDIHGVRPEGAKDLFLMTDEPALFQRAFRWIKGVHWRVDAAKAKEVKT